MSVVFSYLGLGQGVRKKNAVQNRPLSSTEAQRVFFSGGEKPLYDKSAGKCLHEGAASQSI